MDANNSVSSIAFTKDFIISGNRKMIKAGEIIGFGNGNYHYTNLAPSVACIVKKTHSQYTLLNENDLRVKTLLEQYDPSTMVEVFEISSSKDADKIKFLTGELIPHRTTNTKLSVLFEEILMKKQYQKWITTHITAEKDKDNSQVIFNLSSFIAIFSKGTISSSTLNRIIRKVKDAQKGLDTSTTSTPPKQTEPSQLQVTPQQFAPPLDDKRHIENAETKPTSEQLTENSEFEEPTPKAVSDLAEIQLETGMSEPEMQELWDTHSNSKYSYSRVRELLIKKGSNTFTKRLNEHKHTPDRLSVFTPGLEQYLDSLSSEPSDG
jgi:hypothetical protein